MGNYRKEVISVLILLTYEMMFTEGVPHHRFPKDRVDAGGVDPCSKKTVCDDPCSKKTVCDDPCSKQTGCDEPCSKETGCEEPCSKETGCNEPCLSADDAQKTMNVFFTKYQNFTPSTFAVNQSSWGPDGLRIGNVSRLDEYFTPTPQSVFNGTCPSAGEGPCTNISSYENFTKQQFDIESAKVNRINELEVMSKPSVTCLPYQMEIDCQAGMKNLEVNLQWAIQVISIRVDGNALVELSNVEFDLAVVRNRQKRSTTADIQNLTIAEVREPKFTMIKSTFVLVMIASFFIAIIGSFVSSYLKPILANTIRKYMQATLGTIKLI